MGMRRQILGQWGVLPTGRVLEMKMNFLLLCFKKIFCFTQIHVYLEKLENTVKREEGKNPHNTNSEGKYSHNILLQVIKASR